MFLNNFLILFSNKKYIDIMLNLTFLLVTYILFNFSYNSPSSAFLRDKIEKWPDWGPYNHSSYSGMLFANINKTL